MRPRKFGKSWWSVMINYYYAIWHKYKFKKLFSDLYTVKNFTLLRNPYYLLNFDFFGLPIKTDELLLKSFKNEIYNFINAFNGHYKLEYINADIDRTDESADMMSKLFKILDAANLLQKNYIIIDEYDHFANEL